MGKIYYMMGKSSSGKDTIFKYIKERLPSFRTIVPYTTRPIREGERDGVEYFFVGEEKLLRMQQAGEVIELRTYATECGPWHYFTADDGQIDLKCGNYLVIGTLDSYEAMQRYFGGDVLVPIYIEVEDGLRLFRALAREREQKEPKYAELCRRFLADSEDFSDENLKKAGIGKRFVNEERNACLSEIERYIKENMNDRC